MSVPTVSIHYRRLPDRLEVFSQQVVARESDHVVTFLEAATVPKPVEVGGAVVLEPGAPVVWLTYPERWYDLGRFHLRDGTFTGYYANVLTPVRMEGDRWETTDLCLDVWTGRDGAPALLDEDDFTLAVRSGWIDGFTAARARDTAAGLLARASLGAWPPEPAAEWTLERVRTRLARRAPAPRDLQAEET